MSRVIEYGAFASGEPYSHIPTEPPVAVQVSTLAREHVRAVRRNAARGDRRRRRPCRWRRLLIQSPRIAALPKLRDGVIGHRVSLLFSQPLFQAAYDLAGAPQREGNCVVKDFSLRHGSSEHKEKSRYILCRALQEAQAGLKADPASKKKRTASEAEAWMDRWIKGEKALGGVMRTRQS
jgi:hypothetical protein